MILWSINVSSQVNKSLLDTTKLWTYPYRWYQTGVGGGGVNTLYYKIGRDTIVDNNTYRIVYSNVYNGNDSAFLNGFHYEKYLIREDSNRVYLRKMNSDYFQDYFDEYIVYDFGLNIDDTIYLPKIVAGEIRPEQVGGYSISKIDSLYINGTLLKRLELYCFSPPPYTTKHTEIWIEGIGSLNGLFESGYEIGFLYNKLGCMWQGSDLLYTSGECYAYVGMDEIEYFNDIKIYPTIVDNILNIESSQYPLNLSLIDIYGREIYSEKIFSKKNVDCTKLKQGIYLCKIKNIKNNRLIVYKIYKR